MKEREIDVYYKRNEKYLVSIGECGISIIGSKLIMDFEVMRVLLKKQAHTFQIHPYIKREDRLIEKP